LIGRFPVVNHLSRSRGEEGAAASALLVTALLVGLGMFVYMAIPYATAVDAKAKNRSAADAAAIAGAEAAFGDLLASISGGPIGEDLIPGSWGAVPGCAGLGLNAASGHASYNDAVLTDYVFDCDSGQATVRVEGRGYAGQPSRSTATAQVDLPSCDTMPEPPEPEPTEPAGAPSPSGPGPSPGPGSEPGPTPEPADDFELELDCTGFDLRLQFQDTDGDGFYDRFHVPPGQLGDIVDAVDARLVD
jgi:hypothetical protein